MSTRDAQRAPAETQTELPSKSPKSDVKRDSVKRVAKSTDFESNRASLFVRNNFPEESREPCCHWQFCDLHHQQTSNLFQRSPLKASTERLCFCFCTCFILFPFPAGKGLFVRQADPWNSPSFAFLSFQPSSTSRICNCFK